MRHPVRFFVGAEAREPWKHPSYTTRNPRGWGGDPSRGAAMGRRDYFAEDPLTYTGSIWIAPVHINQDGYDRLGTYWGLSNKRCIYWIANGFDTIDCTLSINREHVAHSDKTEVHFVVATIRDRFPKARIKVPRKWHRYPYVMAEIKDLLCPKP